MATSFQCRGLRLWCSRRCEVCTSVTPTAYPQQGFFCPLHRYQEPVAGSDGALAFKSKAIEDHIRRTTSFIAPEALVAADLLKAPGTCRDGKSATGAGIVAWLKEKRGVDDAAALSFAQRMLDLGIVVHRDGASSERFLAERSAQYNILAQAAP